jgi:tol-pal system protein YbgF
MTRISFSVILVVAMVMAVPAGAAAANKEQQQLMAELRMLQEQQQQLQQILGSLGDALKTLTTRLDEQSNVTRKAFADQRLLVEGVGETARILRERADDTNVRLSRMTQELEGMRQTIASIAAQPPSFTAPSTGDPSTTPGAGEQPGGAPPTTAAPIPIIAPQKIYDNAWSDYTAGHYDLAVEGFETFIKTSPRSELADDAQLNIGNAYYAAGKPAEALTALRQVIDGYPQSNSVPAAWYKLGQTYQALKQDDPARKAFETVVKEHSETIEANLARQALERMKRK